MFNIDKDIERDDYFESEHAPAPKKEPKKPALKPDDPSYWDEPESEWEHLKPRRRWRLWCWVAGAGLVIGIIVGIYLRYFSPYVEEATQVGYVEQIERRGTIFKTYEGVMLPYRELLDTTRSYDRDFVFTAADPHTASILRRMSLRNRPVRVEYKRYHAGLPWRGDSRTIVTNVDTVDPASILPPEFAPRTLPTDFSPENP